MATRVEVQLTCDICESADLVSTHSLTVDGKSVEGEACDPCWNELVTALVRFAKVARIPKGQKGSRTKRS